MIHIKHFMVVRDGQSTVPNWKAAEDWLASLPHHPNLSIDVLHVKAYPSGTAHNLILMVDDGMLPEKKV